ncbi:MAG: phosphate ABC transporter substrate-binding protein PstS [Pseudomonadota bacterium]
MLSHSPLLGLGVENSRGQLSPDGIILARSPCRLALALALALVCVSTIALAGCNNNKDRQQLQDDRAQAQAPAPALRGHSEPASTTAPIDIHGAGATFPYPLYSKWFAEYQRVDPRVRINYQSIGSGGGIKQIIERTVDFGATDAPMTADETAKAPARILHVPTTIGAVVVVYNVPGVASGLLMTPETIAGVFLGEITKWNDPRIAATNPRVSLPENAIAVVYRSDGSGTTSVFTEYLGAVSPAWKEKVGVGKSVRFPVGLGAKGNEGVAGQVKTTPGAVGYLELAYAKQTNLAYAAVQNLSGKAAEPSIESITAAAANVSLPNEGLTVSIVNQPGESAYPIAAFTYLLVYHDLADPVKAQALAQFLWWAIHDGQQYGPPLHYAPLPPPVVTRVEEQLRSLRANGKPIFLSAVP